MCEASITLLLLMLWVVSPIHTVGKSGYTQLEDDMVVCLCLGKEGGGCDYLGGKICSGTKRAESFLVGPPRVLP